MKMERTKNASRNIIFGGILKIYQILVPFFMRTFMIHFMGIQYVGLSGLFSSILQVLNLLELGVGSAMVYSMYKPIAEDDKDTICALLRLYRMYYNCIGVVITVVGLLFVPFVHNLISGEIPKDVNITILYLLNLSATVFSYWFLAYKSSILQAYQRMDIMSKIMLMINVIQFCGQFLTLVLLRNYYIYMLISLLAQVLINIVVAIVATKMYPDCRPVGKLSGNIVCDINHRIRDLFTVKVGAVVLSSADTIVISAFLGLSTLALYQNYYMVMTSVIGILTVIFTSCLAGIGNSLITDNLDKVYLDFKKFGLMVIWIAGICVCCFLNLYQPFMYLWMGAENMLDMRCVVLLCLYFYLYVFNQYMCTYKDAAGMWHEDRYRPLVSAMLNLALNLLLVRYIGIFAIILSTVFSYIFVTMPWLFYNLFVVVFKRKPREYLYHFLYCSCIVVIAAVLSYLVCIPISGVGIGGMCIRILVSIVVPNVVFYIFLGKGDDFQNALELINQLTRNKLLMITNKLKQRG